MNEKHKIFNLIILDESGSMQSIKDVTISGFNELVQTIKSAEKQYPEQSHMITFITFNSLGIKTIIDNQAVSELDVINEKLYNPSAMTPLYDAMGHGMAKIEKEVSELNNYNVLVTILTDGMENASKEYSGPQIKMWIEELKTKNWTFTYIGTDHDVEQFAHNIAINNYMRFDKSQGGVNRMFQQERMSREQYLRKIINKEDTQSGYFDNNDNAKDDSSDTKNTPEKK